MKLVLPHVGIGSRLVLPPVPTKNLKGGRTGDGKLMCLLKLGFGSFSSCAWVWQLMAEFFVLCAFALRS
jgi:hypothetical protein